MTSERAQGARRPRISGLGLILIATAVAGIASYVVTWLVPRQIGFASYATFAVFWSFIYLLVGALSGIQQEVTRATGPRAQGESSSSGRAARFAAAAAGLVVTVILVTAFAWVLLVFPEQGWALVPPLAVGAASYVLVAVLCGSLYGLGQWRPLATITVTDALLRLAGLGVALLFTHDIVWLAWAVALPFPVTLILLWPFIRRTVAGRSELDVGYAQLGRNSAHTILAAAATGLMVSGFPLLLGVAARDEPADVVGLYILSITLTRAPLIVVLMSLQSYLVVSFRNSAGAFGRRLLLVLGVILGAGLVLAVAGWLLGSTVFGLLFPGELVPEGWFLAVLVISSMLVGALCVTGSAVLSRAHHAAYTGGWVSSALVTIAMLVLPVDITTKTILALLVGPLAGLVVHGASLSAGRRTVRALRSSTLRGPSRVRGYEDPGGLQSPRAYASSPRAQ